MLYGTTYGGGTSGLGTVFELLPPSSSGGAWTEKALYSFTGGTDGANPQSGIILGKLNVLYGSAFWAGSSTACLLGGYPAGCGTLFELLPPATKGGTWTQKVLYTFTGGTDGAHPYETMSQASAGGLYGSAFSGGSGADVCFPASYPGCGAVYALLPPTTQGGAWIKSGLHVHGRRWGRSQWHCSRFQRNALRHYLQRRGLGWRLWDRVFARSLNQATINPVKTGRGQPNATARNQREELCHNVLSI